MRLICLEVALLTCTSAAFLPYNDMHVMNLLAVSEIESTFEHDLAEHPPASVYAQETSDNEIWDGKPDFLTFFEELL